MSVSRAPRRRLLRATASHAAKNPIPSAPAVAATAIQREFRIGRRRSDCEKTDAQLERFSTGGHASMVQVPGGTKETRRSVAWGKRRTAARSHASTATSVPRRRRRRDGGVPRIAPATSRRFSARCRKKRPRSATAARIVVSTMAISLSPFKREKTICVVITRNVPPKR
jgi:hypothetical protein